METLFELLFGTGCYMTAEIFTILGAIAAAIGAASAIGGGIASGVKAKEAKDELAKSEARRKAEYETDYNQDWTNRSDYLAYMQQLSDKLKGQQETNTRMNIVHGSTPEVTTAQNQALANAYAGAQTTFASKASDKRDAIKKAYQTDEAGYDKARIDIANQEMQNWSNFAQNGISLIGSGLQAIGLGSLNGVTPAATTPTTTGTTASITPSTPKTDGVKAATSEELAYNTFVPGATDPNPLYQIPDYMKRTGAPFAN